jgi:hypothetical protein
LIYRSPMKFVDTFGVTNIHGKPRR